MKMPKARPDSECSSLSEFCFRSFRRFSSNGLSEHFSCITFSIGQTNSVVARWHHARLICLQKFLFSNEQNPEEKNILLHFIALQIFQENLSISFGKGSLNNIRSKKLRNSLQESSAIFSFQSGMTSCIKLEVHTDDHTPHKWCVALGEEVFKIFLSRGNPAVHKVFGDGSLFSTLLFGKFFDPSDAFPLWEFESDILLSHLRRTGQSSVDWFQTDQAYVLKAELPGIGKNGVQIFVENGKIIEIIGQWKEQREPKTMDWRSGHWWEHGYVRRLELPEDADWRKIDVFLSNDVLLEIRIPKNTSSCEFYQGNGAAIKNSEPM